MIELKNVSHTYPNGTKALQDLDLSLSADRFTALIGASGAGKSSLLRILNALVKPTSGAVIVEGRDLAKARPGEVRQARKRIGMVFQGFNLIRRLSALENVLCGRLGYMPIWRSALGSYSRADRELAMSMLERVSLADYAWQRADTLSGGQQQRVGIARALAQRPQLILADEPVSALDPKSARQVMDLLQSISKDDGIAVIANLHFLDTVRDYAERVVGLRAGKLVFDGGTSDLTDEMTRHIYGQEDVPDVFALQRAAPAQPVHAVA